MSNVVIRIQNVDLYLEGTLDRSIRDEIQKRLSFVLPNYKFLNKYKQDQKKHDLGLLDKPWDGTIAIAKVYHNKNGNGILYSPAGLLSYIRSILDNHNVTYTLRNERTGVIKTPGYSTPDLILRDYQRKIVDQAMNRGRGVLKCATGSGKTELIVSMVAESSVFPAIFYVTSCDLLEQAYDRFSKYVRYNGQEVQIGRVGGGHCDLQPITIATVQTSQRVLEDKFTKNTFDDYCPDDKTKLDEKQKSQVKDLIEQAQFVYVDECFSYRTKVMMPDGSTRMIGSLVKNRYSGEVLSFNKDTKKFEPKPVIGWVEKKPNGQVINVFFDNAGTISCTDNHVFHTKRGPQEAKDLVRGDEIISPHGSIVVRGSRNVRYGDRDVYCLTVKDNHTFVANGCTVDNCQHVSCRTIQTIMSASHRAQVRIGGSASPWRDDGLDILIEACFGRLICDIDASYLIKRGYLIKPYITFNHFNQELGPAEDWHAHYRTYVVNNDARNQWIAERARFHMDRGRPTIILVKWSEHAIILSEMIEGSEVLTSSGPKKRSPKKRKQILDKMRSREVMCIIGTSLLDEGVDVPSASAGIFAGGGKSSTRELQRVGRFIRKDPMEPDKKAAFIDEIHDHTRWLSYQANMRKKILRTEREFDIGDRRII